MMGRVIIDDLTDTAGETVRDRSKPVDVRARALLHIIKQQYQRSLMGLEHGPVTVQLNHSSRPDRISKDDLAYYARSWMGTHSNLPFIDKPLIDAVLDKIGGKQEQKARSHDVQANMYYR